MWIHTVQYKLFRVSFLRVAARHLIDRYWCGIAIPDRHRVRGDRQGSAILNSCRGRFGRHSRYVPAGDSSKRRLHTMFQGFKQGKSPLVNSVVALFQPPAVKYFHCHCPLIVTHGNVHGTLSISYPAHRSRLIPCLPGARNLCARGSAFC
jgi:hypothetical protein